MHRHKNLDKTRPKKSERERERDTLGTIMGLQWCTVRFATLRSG